MMSQPCIFCLKSVIYRKKQERHPKNFLFLRCLRHVVRKTFFCHCTRAIYLDTLTLSFFITPAPPDMQEALTGSAALQRLLLPGTSLPPSGAGPPVLPETARHIPLP